MLKYLNLIIVVLAGCFLSSCKKEDISIKNSSSYLYTFYNPSLGPKEGKQKVIITIKENVIYAKDFNTNKVKPLNKIKGFKTLKKALNHQTEGLKVEYSQDGIPKKIIKLGRIGGSFIITLEHL